MFSLCTKLVQNAGGAKAMFITHGLYTNLCPSYAPGFPPMATPSNRRNSRVFPTIHRPNNKNYVVLEREILRKTVERRLS